jgi:hypothetical protein
VMTTATTCRITMREMIDLNLITLLFLCDQVPHSTNGMDLDRSELPSRLPGRRNWASSRAISSSNANGFTIVGTAAQALDAVLEAATRGQNHDGNWIVSMSQVAQQCQPIAIGQAEIQDEGRVKSRSKNRTCLLERGQHIGFVARRLQALGQQSGKLLVVLDDQQSHGP